MVATRFGKSESEKQQKKKTGKKNEKGEEGKPVKGDQEKIIHYVNARYNYYVGELHLRKRKRDEGSSRRMTVSHPRPACQVENSLRNHNQVGEAERKKFKSEKKKRGRENNPGKTGMGERKLGLSQ